MDTLSKFLTTTVNVLITTIFLAGNQGFAQINNGSKLPDRILLNLTADPATSVAVTWPTDTTVHTGYCEWQRSKDARIEPSIVYVVSVSGPKMYPSGTKTWMEKSGENFQFFQVISVQDNALSYQSVKANGTLFDAFKIERKRNGEKRFTELKPNSRAK